MAKYFVLALLLILVLQACIHLQIGMKWYFQDEHTYLTEAWMTSRGMLPMVDYFEMRPPLMEFGGGALFYLFGSSMANARASVLVAQMCTAALVALLARKMLGDGPGLLAAFVYVIMEPAFLGFMFLADAFLALFMAASIAIICLWRPKPAQEAAWAFAAGIAAGMAAAMRQSGMWQAVAIVCLVYFTLSGKPGVRMRRAAVAGVGAVLPFALFAIYYLSVGGIWQFASGVFGGPAQIAGGAVTSPFLGPIEAIFLLAFLPVAYVVYAWKKGKAKGAKWNVLVVAAAAVSGMLAFFPNLSYFHLAPALPAFAIICAWIIAKEPVSPRRNPWGTLFVACALGSTMTLAAFSYVRAGSDGAMPLVTSVSSGEIYALTDYIRGNSAGNDTMMAFPHAPLYFMAQRMPASYYLITGDWHTPPTLERELIAGMENEKPKFVLYVKYSSGYSLKTYAPAVDAYVWENYAPERWVFAEDAFNMSVLRRK